MDDLFSPDTPAEPLVETTPNDMMDDALRLDEGRYAVQGTGQDWYQITSQPGIMKFSMIPGAEPLNLELHLLDSDGTFLRRDAQTAGAESFELRVPETRDYFLRVFAVPLGDTPPPDTPLDYTLVVDLPEQIAPDGNDSRATATDLGDSARDIVGTGGVDWWRFDSLSGLIELTMTPAEHLADPDDPRDDLRNLNMEFYDSTGRLLRSDFASGSDAETIDLLVPADGDYFIKVYTAQFGNNPVPENVLLSYTLDFTPATPDSVTDGNDSIATAEPLGEGRHVVTDGTGTDWYRLESPPGVMSFDMTHTGATAPDGTEMNLNMRLYDADGQPVRSGFAPSADESFEYQFPEAATYYLNVYWAPYPDGAPNGTRLDYVLDIDLPTAVTSDGNDTRATAQDLGPVPRDIVGTGGVDWWRFDSLSGLIELTMTPAEHLADPDDPRDDLRNLNVEIYNSDGQRVRSDFAPGTAAETVAYLAPEAGEYFIKVYTAQFRDDPVPENVLLSYTLDVDLPQADTATDGNDTRATAERLTSGSYTVTDGTESDWYRIQTGPGVMNFDMTHTGATAPDGTEMNLNMRLFDAAGNPVRNGFAPLEDESIEFVAPVTGTYFLNIYWSPFLDRDLPNGVRLDYELEVDLPRNTWSRELDFGPIRNASVTVYDIDGDGRDEIFAGAVKTLDPDTAEEIRPGGLIVLEDTGGTKWTQTFPAIAGPDPKTGLVYNTTSVTTAPVFSDVNGDGQIDILVGVGADNRGEFETAGQPGDLGGLYALDAQGNILWFHETVDSFGGENLDANGEPTGGPDGRPDGFYGAPRVFDIDADGVREVIVASWDHYLYVLDGRNGELEFLVDLHDTAGATPAVADLDRDGLFELVVPADISENPRAGLPQQGGILHVMTNYGHQTVPGWDTQVGTSTSEEFRGKFEPQSLWSSPKVVDLDNNGTLEIVQGTGNFFQDDRGEYIKVWNTDGTQRFQLDTNGRVLASPLIADLDGNGSPEIIAATLQGYVHAWSAGGAPLFATQAMPFDNDTMAGRPDVPIARQPIAVDLTGDGNLEIALTLGAQLIVLDAQGNQITNTERVERAFNNYAGSPVARDIDRDGHMELITGGTTADQDRAVIYRWENIVDTPVTDGRIAEYQQIQSLHEIQAFVDRLYDTVLGRDADPNGRNNWIDRLHTGVLSGADVARGFVFSPEFTGRGTSNEEFVTVLYEAFFDRAPDQRGFERWTGDLESGLSRLEVLQGFTGSPQFANLSASFGIRAEARFGDSSDAAELVGDPTESSTLRGGAGDSILRDTTGPVSSVTPNGEAFTGQVFRLYGATLGREPDSTGFLNWYQGLVRGQEGTGGVTLSQAAGAFVNSAEFQKTYGDLDNTDFVTLLYRNVLDRAPDQRGLDRWVGELDSGTSRAEVVLGFSQSGEFRSRTTPDLDEWMRTVRPEWNDVIEGGAGDDTMNGGIGGDTFVFRNGQGGSDVIHGFEPWDQVQLSGFGFRTPAQAIADMRAEGTAVIFERNGQTITFRDTSMADMQRVKYNLS